MNLLKRLRRGEDIWRGLTVNQYLAQLVESRLAGYYTAPMPQFGVSGRPVERIQPSFDAYAREIYAAHPVIFGLMEARRSVFSEARFCWRSVRNGNPGDVLPINDGLELLERPWEGAQTGTLISRMRQDSDLGGTAFVVREEATATRPARLRRLRPDWVHIVLSGNPWEDLEVDFLGIAYAPNGPDNQPVRTYLPDEVAVWAPIPDPLAQFRGMSWLTPVVRELQADTAATDHRMSTLKQGAWLGPIVTAPQGTTLEQFKKFVEAADSAHAGPNNAGKMVFLAPGSEIKTVAQSLKDLDMKSISGMAETRIAVASRVPAVIAQISEGLQGSSLNSGNYTAAKRQWIDGSLRPDWRSLCEALSNIIPSPDLSGLDLEPGTEAQLWILESDIALLHQDRLEAAEVRQANATTINTLVTAGFDPKSIVEAVRDDDLSRLKHTGLTSVQLTPPGEGGEGEGFGESPDPEGEDEYQRALEELRGQAGSADAQRSRRWVSRASDHWRFQPRVPRGDERGGQWIAGPNLGDLVEALQRWTEMYRRSSGDPLGTVDLGLSDVDEVDSSFTLDDPGGVLDDLEPSRRDRIGQSLFTYATSTTSQLLNDALRQGSELPPWLRAMVEDLDAATEASELSNHAELYRGIRDPRRVFGEAWNDDDVTGLAWTEDAFLSTSADERIASWFAGDDQVTSDEERAGNAVVMTIVAPRGTGAVRLSESGTGQAELLLQRGLTLRVVRDDGVDSSGIRRLDVEVVSVRS